MNRGGTANQWEWSPEIWAWSPILGRWSPRFGPPKLHTFFEVSTHGVAPGEAYDYWREIAYYQFDADRRPPGDLTDFNAWAKAVVAPSGDLFVYESSGVSGQRTSRQIRADEADRFNFGIVLEGRRIHQDEADGVSIAGPGDFFTYDAAKPSRVKWTDHRGIHLSLPRQMVQSVIGDIPSGSVVARKLSASALAPFLKSHLSVLAREIASLSDIDRAAIFDNTMDLAITVLRQAFANPSKPPALDRRGYVAFARRIIIEQLANPNLDAAMIAGLLGCSRATLYRAFAEFGLSVAGYIRETRLEEAMRLLVTGSHELTIESLANRCGFVDVTHFRRAFRAQFGINPHEARSLYSESFH